MFVDTPSHISFVVHALLCGGLLIALSGGLLAGAAFVACSVRRSATPLHAREARARRHHFGHTALLAVSAAALIVLCLIAIQEIPGLRYVSHPAHVTTTLERLARIESALSETQHTAGLVYVDIVSIREALKDLATKRASDTPNRLQFREIGSIHKFPRSETCDAHPSAAAEVSRIAHEIVEVAKSATVYGIYVVGGHDVRPLSAHTQAKYDSNSVLAFRRASCVADASREELRGMFPNAPVIPMIGGPQHLGPETPEALLESDRKTTINLLTAAVAVGAELHAGVADARP